MRANWRPYGQARDRLITQRSGRVGDEYWWECELCFDGKLIFSKRIISDRIRRGWAAQRSAKESPQEWPPDEARKEEERIDRLKRIVASLPEFAPESMTDGERQLMRVLRALDDQDWEFMASFAESMLSGDKYVCLARPKLSLVVDNTESNRGESNG